MRSRQVPSAELLRLAAEQAGAVTVGQAVGLGLSRHAVNRLVADGRWQRLGQGALFTESGAVRWLALAWSGVLLGGPRARLAAAPAGHLLGLVPAPPIPVQVLVPLEGPVRVRGPWEFCRERPGARSAQVPERRPG